MREEFIQRNVKQVIRQDSVFFAKINYRKLLANSQMATFVFETVGNKTKDKEGETTNQREYTKYNAQNSKNER